jgi:hypothetical protein
VYSSHKRLDFFTEIDCSIYLFAKTFSYRCAPGILVKDNKTSFYEKLMELAEFRILGDFLAENICQELATLQHSNICRTACTKVQNWTFFQFFFLADIYTVEALKLAGISNFFSGSIRSLLHLFT